MQLFHLKMIHKSNNFFVAPARENLSLLRSRVGPLPVALLLLQLELQLLRTGSSTPAAELNCGKFGACESASLASRASDILEIIEKV